MFSRKYFKEYKDTRLPCKVEETPLDVIVFIQQNSQHDLKTSNLEVETTKSKDVDCILKTISKYFDLDNDPLSDGVPYHNDYATLDTVISEEDTSTSNSDILLSSSATSKYYDAGLDSQNLDISFQRYFVSDLDNMLSEDMSNKSFSVDSTTWKYYNPELLRVDTSAQKNSVDDLKNDHSEDKVSLPAADVLPVGSVTSKHNDSGVDMLDLDISIQKKSVNISRNTVLEDKLLKSEDDVLSIVSTTSYCDSGVDSMGVDISILTNSDSEDIYSEDMISVDGHVSSKSPLTSKYYDSRLDGLDVDIPIQKKVGFINSDNTSHSMRSDLNVTSKNCEIYPGPIHKNILTQKRDIKPIPELNIFKSNNVLSTIMETTNCSDSELTMLDLDTSIQQNSDFANTSSKVRTRDFLPLTRSALESNSMYDDAHRYGANKKNPIEVRDIKTIIREIKLLKSNVLTSLAISNKLYPRSKLNSMKSNNRLWDNGISRNLPKSNDDTSNLKTYSKFQHRPLHTQSLCPRTSDSNLDKSIALRFMYL